MSTWKGNRREGKEEREAERERERERERGNVKVVIQKGKKKMEGSGEKRKEREKVTNQMKDEGWMVKVMPVKTGEKGDKERHRERLRKKGSMNWKKREVKEKDEEHFFCTMGPWMPWTMK